MRDLLVILLAALACLGALLLLPLPDAGGMNESVVPPAAAPPSVSGLSL